MPRQFDVLRLGDGTLVVVLQDDMHERLSSRVVAPLVPLGEAKHQPKGLCPTVTLDDERHAIFLPTMASLPIGTLGPATASLADQREAIVRGLDLLFNGV